MLTMDEPDHRGLRDMVDEDNMMWASDVCGLLDDKIL
jgi:hypothetical protein